MPPSQCKLQLALMEALYDINDVGMRWCVVAAVAANAAAAMLPHLQH
jgi:hypothetical protein